MILKDMGQIFVDLQTGWGYFYVPDHMKVLL